MRGLMAFRQQLSNKLDRARGERQIASTGSPSTRRLSAIVSSPRKGPTMPDVGRCGSTEFQRCLMPLEIPEIEGPDRPPIDPRPGYPRALASFQIASRLG